MNVPSRSYSSISFLGFERLRFHGWEGVGWRSPKLLWRPGVAHVHESYTCHINGYSNLSIK